MTIERSLRVEFDEQRIDRLFERFNQSQLPGAAVGIALSGKPLYRKAFGLASMELPVTLSPQMRMRIGSVSKHFTALAFMLLCEEGRATLDAPLGQHLPDLHPVARQVTARHLMGHLSGLRDAHDLAFQFSGTGRSVSSAELLSFYQTLDDVNAAPGAQWNYSNGGYLLLTALIERISGCSLEDFLRERIFEPAGMWNTLLRRQDTDFVPNSATLHMTRLGGGFERSYMGLAFAGEGGIVSTIDDLLRWCAQMDHPWIGTAATWSAMTAPQQLVGQQSTGYGFGLIRGRYRGTETLFHPGGGMGGNAQMLKVPAAHLDVVVIVNRHDAWASELANSILDACLTDLEPLLAVADQSCATGVFRSPSSRRVIQLGEDHGQQIVTIDGFDWPYVREADGVLRPVPIWRFVNQEVHLIGERHRPEAIRFVDCGQADDLARDETGPDANFEELVGLYRSDTTGTEVTLARTAGGANRCQSRGRFGSVEYRMEPVCRGVWRARPTGALPWLGGWLLFDPQHRGFEFTSLRTWALPFRREH